MGKRLWMGGGTEKEVRECANGAVWARSYDGTASYSSRSELRCSGLPGKRLCMPREWHIFTRLPELGLFKAGAGGHPPEVEHGVDKQLAIHNPAGA